MTARVLVDGVDLEAFGPVGDLVDSTIWRTGGGYSGDYEASCTFGAPADFAAPWFHSGATFDVVENGLPTWSGFMAEPDQGDVWTLHAFGWGADAANYATEAGSTAIEAHVDAAESRGMGFSRFANELAPDLYVGAVPMLNEALDLASQAKGRVWWVADGELSFRQESTDVDWLMTPDSTYLGTADEELVTRLVARYVAGVDGDGNPLILSDVYYEDEEASAKFRPHERVLDLTELLVIGGGSALTIAAERFAQIGARAGYTNGFTMTPLNSSDARTAVPDPLGVRAGHRVRLPGLTDLRAGVTYLASEEVTLGKVTRRHAEQIAVVEPVGLVPRDFAGALAAATAPSERTRW